MNEILNGNILKVRSKFVIVSVVGVVLNTIYSLVDGIFVGQGVGEAGLASVNIVWPAVTVIIGTGLMIGIGSSSLIAIHMGRGNSDDAEKVLGTVIKSILLVGSILMIGGLLSLPLAEVLTLIVLAVILLVEKIKSFRISTGSKSASGNIA